MVSDSSLHRRRTPLLDIWVDDLSMGELLDEMAAGRAGVVFTLNPDHLYHLRRDPAFLHAYRSADIVTLDSHYVRLALRLLGRRAAHRLPGSDIVPAFCACHGADPRQRVFLLGARPGVAQRARERINARAGRELVVGAHGPSMNFVDDPAETQAVIEQIDASGANVLFVGLGAPKQEIWIAGARARLPKVRVFMGVGATLDYEAGTVTRAPAPWRRVGLEWFYRVASEPRRYLMRYVRCAPFAWWMLLDALKPGRRSVP